MVFYRKYRPQKVSELDLPHVREKLASVLSSKELPHAFLFTGSKGLGKTSSARILAKAINCENRGQRQGDSVKDKGNKKRESLNAEGLTLSASIEPCNKCEACISITNGSNIDVLEIDAASNGGVEEIRFLREKVKFASSSLLKKVYIIDEVHMLSTGAFNALLKTLEEPPQHVVFILATTELHKLPATVISRTFQVKFEKPKIEDIVGSLGRIVKGEGLDIEKGVLEKVAASADGAFRDAAKNLEELVFAANGNKITNELFDEVFKTGSVKEEVLDLLEAYAKRDAKRALETVARLSKSGADFKVVIERMVDHLRGLLMMRNGIESEEADVRDLSLKDINELLRLSNEAYSEMKLSFIPSLPLELMTVKYCILDNDEDMREVNNNKRLMIKEKREGRQEKEEIEKSISLKTESDKSGTRGSVSSDLLKDLINELNKVNKPGAALLRSASTASVINGILTVKTPFPIHAERLKSERVFGDLLKVSSQLAGDNVQLEIEVASN